MLLLGGSASFSQILSARVGVNGLTCSQCSRSVEMHLKKLPFVAAVHMDLQQTEALVSFTKKGKVSVDQLAKAVVKAGFAVRKIEAEMDMGSVKLDGGKNCFLYGGEAYRLVEPAKFSPQKHTLVFLNPHLLSKEQRAAYGGLNNKGTFNCGSIYKSPYLVQILK